VTRKKQSLVLITVDCLRADHCGFYGYSRSTTPFLDSLASESLVIPTAVIAGAPTYYSLPAIFASRMPLALGRDVIGLAPDEETLTKALRQAGYATAAFTAANPYISPCFGFDQGFDLFRDFLDFDSPVPEATANAGSSTPPNETHRATLNHCLKQSAQALGLSRLYYELYFQYLLRIAAPPVSSMEALRKYPSADFVVEAAKSWLSMLEPRPFFLWLHMMDPHAPYYPPPTAFRQLAEKQISPTRARYLNEFWNRSDLSANGLRRNKKSVMDLYDASIRWADCQIAQLVEYLKQANRWDDCVLVFTADHGEEFLEHGHRFHLPVSMAEEIARVPLLFRVAGRPAWPRANHSTFSFSHLHLAPTLLEILDVPSPRSFQGKSLWRRLQQEASVDDAPDPFITECIYGCSNPFRVEMRLSPRLLSVRDQRYKLVVRVEPGSIEKLFDLQSDPAEENPLPGREALEVRKRLLKIAAEHMERTISARPTMSRLKTRLRDLRLELNP
jgi:arylsulfatase A-like enzyme